jgi:hypothetical protein
MIHCILQVYALQTFAANLMFTAQPTKQISKIFYFAKALLFNFVILQMLFFSELKAYFVVNFSKVVRQSELWTSLM